MSSRAPTPSPPDLAAPLSADPRADAVLRDTLAHCVRALAESTHAPLAILLQGSAARGEAWVIWESPGEWVSVSDLDCAVVVRDEDVPAWRARARSWGQALARLPGGDRILVPSSLGVFTQADLARQAAKPGTIELASAARILWGDASALDRLHAPRAVAREECVRLVANRCAEWLRARAIALGGMEADRAAWRTADGRAVRAWCAASVKLACDAWTALAAADGSTAVSLRERTALLETPEAPDGVEAATRESLRLAHRIRLSTGTWEDVDALLGEGPLAWRDRAEALQRLARTCLAAAPPARLAPRAPRAWRAWARVIRRAPHPADAIRRALRTGLATPPWRVGADALWSAVVHAAPGGAEDALDAWTVLGV